MPSRNARHGLRGWLDQRLSRRIAFWAMVITSATLLLGLAASVSAALWTAQRQADTAAQGQAERLASALADKLDELDDQIGALARSSLVANGLSDSAGRDEYLLPLLREQLMRQKYGAVLRLCDALGRVAASSDAVPADAGAPASGALRGHDPACGDAAPFDAALRDGRAGLVLTDSAPGRVMLRWTAPVRLRATGTNEGAVIAEVPLRELLRVAAGAEGSYAALLVGGETVASSGTAVPARGPEARFRAAAVRGKGAALDLRARVGLDRGLDAVPWRPIVGLYVAGTVLLSALAGALALLIAGRLTRPLEIVGALAESPEGGDPAAWERLARRPDEIGAFAQRLRQLTERLAAQLRDLDAARRAAEAASIAKTEFLATISHEIRTPLNAVTGLTALALTADGATQRQHLAQAQRSAQQLARLVDEVLDLTRIESGRMDIEQAPCRLDDLLQQVADAVGPAAQAKQLPLIVQAAPDVPPQLAGDRLRLVQVLVNLVANAVKFTFAGQVVLRVACVPAGGADGERIVFEVEDTGIGIRAEDQALIFEAFRQAEATTTRRFGGSGLGLAICKRLVGLMDGRITLRSAPGQGSCFRVELPLLRVAMQADEEPARDVGDAGEGLRAMAGDRAILVVEDDEVNRLLTRLMVERLGLRVVDADSGLAALDRLRAPGGIAAVLMDCHMPGIDGFETTRRLRAEPHGARLPVIACTADVLTEDRDSCIAAGMDDYLSKPIHPAALVAVLRRCLVEPTVGPDPEPAGMRDSCEHRQVEEATETNR